MSATVAAALKKIAVALLSNKKVLKTVGMIILVLIVALLLPLMALEALLNGDIELDTDTLLTNIQENLSDSDAAMLTGMEDAVTLIDEMLDDVDMRDMTEEAEILYFMALYREPDVQTTIERLVSCFEEDIEYADLIDNVNAEFGTNISLAEFEALLADRVAWRQEREATADASMAATES